MTTIPRAKSKPRTKAASAPGLLDCIEQALDDGKAEDVVVIDLHGKTSIADHMVIATGRSQRQVSALAERVLTALRERGSARASSEGMRQGDWVLIDAGDVIVHLFRPDVRGFYNLEKMWGAELDDAGGAAS
ncbi:MAG TPA: ribosome silencing factor [Stellaceae bacterium]|nr:ribosome silencing factor [Stellaceae bacterium]